MQYSVNIFIEWHVDQYKDVKGLMAELLSHGNQSLLVVNLVENTIMQFWKENKNTI